MIHALPISRFHQSTRTVILALLTMLVSWSGFATETNSDSRELPVKFGFTRSMFVDLNEGDTRAAVKSYSILLASKDDLAVSDSPGVLENAAAVAAAFTSGTADIISLTSTEFLSLPDGLVHPRMISAAVGGTYFEQYVLLARNDSGIKTIADLQNKRLLIYGSLRGSLSPIWLDVLLATNGFAEAKDFFGSVTPVNKPSRTVLPVFFQQADACIVTRTGFEVLSEMNPQVTKQMKIIATSPQLIPTVTCFRAGISPRALERIIHAVVSAQHTVAGQQVLTIFQSDGIAEIRTEQIESVRELIATQARLRHPSAKTVDTVQ